LISNKKNGFPGSLSKNLYRVVNFTPTFPKVLNFRKVYTKNVRGFDKNKYLKKIYLPLIAAAPSIISEISVVIAA